MVHCEFIGTSARIVQSTNHHNVGISGRVVDETRNTFAIMQRGKRKIVPKHSSILNFTFRDGTIVEIEGRLLSGRSEDRLKKTIRRLW